MSNYGELSGFIMVALESESLYVGEFRHNLDAKNRVTVPSKWRFRGDDIDVYVAWPHPNGYIVVYPPRKIEEFREKLLQIPESDSRGQRTLQKLFGKAHNFGCDSQGRIKLHEKLVQSASIEKEVVLVGLVEKFTIWGAEQFDQQDEEEFDLQTAMKDLGI